MIKMQVKKEAKHFHVLQKQLKWKSNELLDLDVQHGPSVLRELRKLNRKFFIIYGFSGFFYCCECRLYEFKPAFINFLKEYIKEKGLVFNESLPFESLLF